MTSRSAPGAFLACAAIAAIVLVAFLTLPMVSLFVRMPPEALLARLVSREVLDALRLSLVTSLAATALVLLFGTPVAYLLATRAFRGKRLVETLVDLPMVIPPTVAGFALLLAFGRAGLAGGALRVAGIELPFTTAGVVVAQAFMAAPFYVGPARAGFASVDRSLREAATTLRAGEAFTFFRVILPLSMPALVAGTGMCCARALGEFGATITFAGNLPGVTQTMPLAVYVALHADLEAAVAMSLILLVCSFGLLLVLRSGPGLAATRFGAARSRP